MNLLKRHPFPVLARFERVVAVSFAFPESTLGPLVQGTRRVIYPSGKSLRTNAETRFNPASP